MSFLTAVVARRVRLLQGAAQGVVRWYSVRYWTFWIPLIGLPAAAVLTGVVALAAGWSDSTGERRSATIWATIPTRTIIAATLAAGRILVVVGPHMLAN